MGMDLCYFGVKKKIYQIYSDGKFFDEDFTNLEPQHTLRVFSAKDFYYLYSSGKN